MATIASHTLSVHLKRLEAESIGILREVAAEFRNPVMLYSIGKDSGVLLHLAIKAFYPSTPPFPFALAGEISNFRAKEGSGSII
jgi:sulfate adenylyltransferase subunit 2